MGIFDRFRHHKDDAGGTGTALKDRAAGMMSGHAEQAGQGLDRAGKMVDDKTGGKYSDQIDSGVGRAKDVLGQQSGQESGAMDETTPNLPPTDMGAQGDEGAEQHPQG